MKSNFEILSEEKDASTPIILAFDEGNISIPPFIADKLYEFVNNEREDDYISSVIGTKEEFMNVIAVFIETEYGIKVEDPEYQEAVDAIVTPVDAVSEPVVEEGEYGADPVMDTPPETEGEPQMGSSDGDPTLEPQLECKVFLVNDNAAYARAKLDDGSQIIGMKVNELPGKHTTVELPNDYGTARATPFTPGQLECVKKAVTEAYWKAKGGLMEAEVAPKEKVLIIMRGISGSGKSTKAKSFGGNVYSTDDFFMENEEYKFDPSKIVEAHGWNQNRVKEAMSSGETPIVVDNTNTQKWEAKPYVLMAKEFGYAVKVEESDTPWRFDAEELSKRNVHGVPKPAIQGMVDRYDKTNWNEDIDSIGAAKAPWEK